MTTVSDISDGDAVVVFDRLNKGGSALCTGDVRAAELARGPAITVLKRMREWVSEERPKRLGFGFSFAFRALVVFHRDSAQFASLRPDWMEAPGPEGQTLQQSWKETERATNEALRFIDEEMGWSRRALVPSANAIIVLAYALARTDFKVGSSDKELLRRWLCLTALRGVFQGSVETVINRFLRAVKDRKRISPAQALVESLKRDWARPIRADELLRPSQLWGAATQVAEARVRVHAEDSRAGALSPHSQNNGHRASRALDFQNMIRPPDKPPSPPETHWVGGSLKQPTRLPPEVEKEQLTYPTQTVAQQLLAPLPTQRLHLAAVPRPSHPHPPPPPFERIAV